MQVEGAVASLCLGVEWLEKLKTALIAANCTTVQRVVKALTIAPATAPAATETDAPHVPTGIPEYGALCAVTAAFGDTHLHVACVCCLGCRYLLDILLQIATEFVSSHPVGSGRAAPSSTTPTAAAPAPSPSSGTPGAGGGGSGAAAGHASQGIPAHNMGAGTRVALKCR